MKELDSVIVVSMLSNRASKAVSSCGRLKNKRAWFVLTQTDERTTIDSEEAMASAESVATH